MSFIQRRIDAAHRAGPTGRPHLLIVEDQDEARLLMQYALRTTFRTDAVAGALAALRRARTTLYDACLLDITLGFGESGIDLMADLRALDGYADTPMIAVTAHALPGDRQRFLDLGFDAYVAKPFAPADLRQQVTRVVTASAAPATTPALS